MSCRTSLTLLCLPLLLAGTARAQLPPDEKPFAEHHVVFQISDDTEAKEHQVLNNVENIMKVFGPDKISVEVVAFGPGLDLLKLGNQNGDHIGSLVKQGVRFDACQNTIDTWERNNGKPYPLSPLARRVPSGVAQIVYLAEHGYTNIRP